MRFAWVHSSWVRGLRERLNGASRGQLAMGAGVAGSMGMLLVVILIRLLDGDWFLGGLVLSAGMAFYGCSVWVLDRRNRGNDGSTRHAAGELAPWKVAFAWAAGLLALIGGLGILAALALHLAQSP